MNVLPVPRSESPSRRRDARKSEVEGCGDYVGTARSLRRVES